MQFPARFSDLPEYAFPRLRRLLDGMPPGGPELAMTIGEPRHPLPEIVGRIVAEHAGEFAHLPAERRHARAARRHRRLAARAATASRSTPRPGSCALNGTREGLFNAALALSPGDQGPARGRWC